MAFFCRGFSDGTDGCEASDGLDGLTDVRSDPSDGTLGVLPDGTVGVVGVSGVDASINRLSVYPQTVQVRTFSPCCVRVGFLVIVQSPNV